MAAARKPVPKKVVKKPPVKRPIKATRASTSYSGPRQPDITRDVKAAVVDEVPAAGGSGQRKYRYQVALAAIRQEVGHGRPVRLARFIGASGAATVKREIEAGRKPCDGDVSDWQFDARRLAEGGSILYATLVGEDGRT